MNWVNISIATLGSEEFVGSDPTERATWLCLLGYCCAQENGGIIEDCLSWKDRKWQQLVRVTAKEVGGNCDLWKWEGNDLIVSFYPIEQEEEAKARRETARTNGKKGGRPKQNPPETDAETPEKPTSDTSWNQPPNLKDKDKDQGNTPIAPKGADEGDDDGTRILPKGWQHKSLREQKQVRCLRNSPAMIRIGSWFGRRPDNLWTIAEAGTLHRVHPTPEDIEELAAYYEADIPRDLDYRRRDLPTLLNNWAGELDRARIWKAENP